MNQRLPVLSLLAILFISGCKTAQLPASTSAALTATITEEGFLNCFAAGTSLNGKTVWCETSAVALDGKNLIFANDKDMPAGQSPVFTKTPETLADSTQSPTYLTQPTFTRARKYEDFAQTPDRKFILLTTAFDRIKPGSHDWDAYNTILYWRSGDEQHPKVLAPDDTSRNSMVYRQRIAQVLANNEFPGEMPYFKIEGLAATDNQLLFGIREMGKSYESFTYQAKIISVSYRTEKNGNTERIRLLDDWKLINDFDLANADPTLPKPLGLSSLEYDPFQKRFWMLTSQEDNKNGKLDAYLWTATSEELYGNKPFTLVRDPAGQPVHTAGHKAEDLTPLDGNRLLLICDDDTSRTTVGSRIRQPNQAAYTIVTVSNQRNRRSQ
ncbi:hypothetical protein GO730_33650 [Spirosoma sp. HMF3257]|uniref:Esterase-like activity of phytase family protein n=1 Tax=Spirosoma telluris TaxID=2183553 RepID=A0A327NQX0_9BACT|nr:hypothetical protein [Spirosoma telluris]RAI77831.1 hypothetical protein HMF3257_33555 [Spirosoma telluris]